VPAVDFALENFHAHFKTPRCASETLFPCAPDRALTKRREANMNCPIEEMEELVMPKFVIERDIPGAGKLSPAELKAISKKSCGVLSSLGPAVQWIQSFVTADKLYCIYHAADESLVRRHAELGGFPANKITPVTSVIDPATAE
jgi:hypothetical protein